MKNEKLTSNIPSMSIAGAMACLMPMYASAINVGLPLRTLTPPLFLGPPGIGKSSAVKQMAEDLERTTGRKVHVVVLSLPLYTPSDLMGIPRADTTGKYTTFLKPQILDLDESEDIINLIFLDEITDCVSSVQRVAYQLCLERRVGEHQLPDNTIVMAAGNRSTDNTGSYRLSAALANRMRHFNIESSLSAWKDWAMKNGIDSRIIGYLSFDPSRLCGAPTPGPYPSPRSWASVSQTLFLANQPIEDLVHLIASDVGNDTALEFVTWCMAQDQLPDLDTILEGTCARYPRDHGSMYALVNGLTQKLMQLSEVLTQDEMNHAYDYINRYPNLSDFAAVFAENLKGNHRLNTMLANAASVRRTSRRKSR